MTWSIKKTGEVAEIYQGGKSGLTKKDYTESGFPAFSATGQDGFTKKSFDSGNAVILSAIGARCGKCFYAEGKWTAIANTQVIKFDNPITARFMYYYLNDESRWPRFGSAQPFIAPSTVKRLKVPFPSSKIQQKIVERLDAIKKAEELNNKQIELAEELFQSLLHRQLDPKGKNWEIKKLESLVLCGRKGIKIGPFGSALKIGELVERGPIRVIYIENVVNNELDLREEKYITAEKYKELTAYTVSPGDVLITIMGTIGRVCVVPHNIGKAIISSHLIKITPHNNILLPEFLYFSLLGSTFIIKQMADQATGAIMSGLNSTILRNLKIPLPPIETQRKIVEKLSAVQDYKKKLLEQKQKLQELFESVLNKSFKGQL